LNNFHSVEFAYNIEFLKPKYSVKVTKHGNSGFSNLIKKIYENSKYLQYSFLPKDILMI